MEAGSHREPVVETSGGWLRGRVESGVAHFRGIPYARAPRGLLRFQPPLAPSPWRGVRDARRPGRAAPQPGPALAPVRLDLGTRIGEDCLSLNVATPSLEGPARPVLVWIHGGAFVFGAGSSPLYEARRLARRGDLVVVTLNYRLGGFGFVHLHTLGDEDFRHSSNLGLRDQIAALEWIRDNIAVFGGDPHNVTVAGQSAGAMCAAALLVAPRAQSLFHRAILQSGAADHVQTPETAAHVARVFLSEVGLRRPDRRALAALPTAQLLRAQRRTWLRTFDAEQLMAFLPAVDGDVLPVDPVQGLREGRARDRAVLLGTNLDEWNLFRVPDLVAGALGQAELVGRGREGLRRAGGGFGLPLAERAARAYRDAVAARGGQTNAFALWSAFQSARVFHYPASRLAEAHGAGGGRVFSYLFTWRPPLLRRTLGAFHALELPFVFGWTQQPTLRAGIGLSTGMRQLSLSMQHAWASFARRGNPGHSGLPVWDAYEAPARATMVLGRECYLAEAPLEPERRFWEAAR
ncbi:MAG: carboxylesterase/lipase family protein [Proteobacteria bacterium]|nr:carboxylesterase/lipase family protein [Pseudomonadota bacterium]